MPIAPILAGIAKVAGSALPAITSLINNRRAARQSRENTDRTHRANMELAKYQYNKDLEMWNKQNEYNSPENQMLRFKEAGLNPHLIYGQGNAGNASSMPSYNAPTMDFSKNIPFMLPNMLSQFQDFQLKQAQIDNVKAKTSLTATEAWIANQLKGARVTSGRYKSITSGYQMEAARENVTRQFYEAQQSMSDALFKKYRNDWAKLGIYSSDNIYLRLLSKQLIDSGVDLNFSTLMSKFIR